MAFDLEAELVAIIDAFDTANVEYAVCGALAVALHGFPRATMDIDVLIAEANLEEAEEAIAPLGYTIPGGIIPFQSGTEREQRVFRVSKVEGEQLLTLDLLLVTPIMQPVWDSRVTMKLTEREISVVSRDGLATMKRLAGRHKDLADLEGLGIDVETDN